MKNYFIVYYLNSNIEIHKYQVLLHHEHEILYLNSNIEIHKFSHPFYNFLTFKI